MIEMKTGESSWTPVRWRRVILLSPLTPDCDCNTEPWEQQLPAVGKRLGHPPKDQSEIINLDALDHVLSPIEGKKMATWEPLVKMSIAAADTFQTVICQPSKCFVITLNYAVWMTLLGYGAG